MKFLQDMMKDMGDMGDVNPKSVALPDGFSNDIELILIVRNNLH